MRGLTVALLLLAPMADSAVRAAELLRDPSAREACACGQANFCRRQRIASEACHHGDGNGAATQSISCNCGAERGATQLVGIRPFVLPAPSVATFLAPVGVTPRPRLGTLRPGFSRIDVLPPRLLRG